MTDQPNRYTLAEAARLTGLSTEALRLRIRRGKLASEKRNDGIRVVLTTADIEAIVAGQERQQIPTDRTERPNDSRALADAVATLVDMFGQDRTDLKAEAAALRQRVERVEAELARERDRAEGALIRAAASEAEVKALREELVERRKPLWRRVTGL